ncbi:COBRA extracellular glycosyl-phosphatidyl inositol-anchored protein family [Trifolium repens]|nr:COBRA extracellular glycosyl-phosphatidyl inositol-anchored protein family [Trifolium repens]
MLCKCCGIYGHVARNCPTSNIRSNNQPKVAKDKADANVEKDAPEKTSSAATPTNDKANKESPDADAECKGEELYGDWLVVNRKKNQGRPQFHPGGGVESTKVWTKRNKRAWGMTSKPKEPNNNILVSQPNKSIGNQPRHKSLQLERQVRVGLLTQPIIFNGTMQTGSNERKKMDFGNLQDNSERSKQGDEHLKPPEPNEVLQQQEHGISGIDDEMVVETPLSRQGFASKKSRNHMHELVSRYRPDLLILVETHIAFSSAESFFHRENYEKIDVQEAQGHSGGIWIMQRRGCDFKFAPVSKMHQYPDTMRTGALNFFKELFCTRQEVFSSNNEDDISALDDEAVDELSKPITKKECTSDGYVALVTINNFQKFRQIKNPGWTLGWSWAKKEFIWDMLGAQTTEQGDCSRFKGNIIPHCCKKIPTVVDLLPGEAGTSNKTVRLLKNFTLLAPGPGYTCSPTKIVPSSIFLSLDKRRTVQAFMTWDATCKYSQG